MLWAEAIGLLHPDAMLFPCAVQLCIPGSEELGSCLPWGPGRAAISHGGLNGSSSPKQTHNSPDRHGEFNPLVWDWHRLEFQGL